MWNVGAITTIVHGLYCSQTHPSATFTSELTITSSKLVMRDEAYPRGHSVTCSVLIRPSLTWYYICSQPQNPNPLTHHYSADALASASCRCGGNLYRSWLVYVVRSIVICLSCSTIILRVPSLPLNCTPPPPDSCSRCRTQLMMVHMSRLGTLIDTGWGRPVNLLAYALISAASPLASRGRISRLRIFCGKFG